MAKLELSLSFLKDIVHRNMTITEDYFLNALIITNCNGTGQVPFSKAYVEYDISGERFPRLAFFGDGFIRIAEAVKGIDAFRGENTYANFEQTVFKETRHLQCLKSMLENDIDSEASIRNILAAHYFGPLAYGNNCLVDKGSSSSCDYCQQKLKEGDTSLGHPSIWHGRADIIIASSVIKVTAEPEDDDDDDDDSKDCGMADGDQDCGMASFSSVMDKLEKADSSWALSQALAQTFVNGFCEARKKKHLSGKFIPSFLATEKTIRIIWYNRDFDILLLSSKMQIWNDYNETLNIDTQMQVWLALNFENYDMVVMDSVLRATNRSNFKGVVGEKKYDIYLKKASKPCTHVKENHYPKLVPPPIDDSALCLAQAKTFYYRKLQAFDD